MNVYTCRSIFTFAFVVALNGIPNHGAETPGNTDLPTLANEVVKVERLLMKVEGWADGKPQPLTDEYGSQIPWSWYRLSFDVGAKTCVFYSMHNPYIAGTFNVSLVEREGKEWLLARMGGRHDSYKPYVYFPMSLEGKPGGFHVLDKPMDTWEFRLRQKLFDWESSPALKRAGKLSVVRLVNGKPAPMPEDGLDRVGEVYRATIQHNGQTYSFYLCEVYPIYGRLVKVTREQYRGQDCFRLCGLLDELPWCEYLPVHMAGRYGRLLPVEGRRQTNILCSLDEAMADFFGLTEEKPTMDQAVARTVAP